MVVEVLSIILSPPYGAYEGYSLFLSTSTWLPPKGRDAALETCTKRVRMDVELQLVKRLAFRSKNNLMSEERTALRDFVDEKILY